MIPKKVNSSNRNSAIDQTKGILIVLVLVFHVTYQGNYPEIFHLIKDAVYSFHMAAFLIITGYYLQPLDKSHLIDFIRKIVIPHYLFYFVYLVALLAISNYTKIDTSNKLYSANHFFEAYLFKPIGSYWYLHSAIMFYISTALSFRLTEKLSFRHRIAATLILSILFVFLYKLAGGEFYWWVYLSLLLGLTLNISNNTLKPNVTLFLSSIVTFTLAYILGPKLLNVAAGLIALQVLIRIFQDLEFATLSFLGRNSLLILLLHTYPLNIVKFIEPALTSLDQSGLLNILLSTIFSIVFCLLLGYAAQIAGVGQYLFGKSRVIA